VRTKKTYSGKFSFCLGLMITVGTTLLTACNHKPLQDIHIADTHVFPESLSASEDGTIYIGSVKGNIYKADPGASEAKLWVLKSEENGLNSLLGVLVDDPRKLVWVCAIPGLTNAEPGAISEVVAFRIEDGSVFNRYPFPGGGVCNDLTIASDGTLYATDTPGGRVLVLTPGSTELEVYGADNLLKGIDGIAISASGKIVVNNVQTQKMYLVEPGAEGMKGLTELVVDLELGGPDGLRLVGGETFIQAEGTAGRVSLLTLDGTVMHSLVLNDSFISSPGVTVIDSTAYVLESHIAYLFDPALQNSEPPPFIIKAVPLP
jgi:sugar lactone lactonase YvrE